MENVQDFIEMLGVGRPKGPSCHRRLLPEASGKSLSVGVSLEPVPRIWLPLGPCNEAMPGRERKRQFQSVRGWFGCNSIDGVQRMRLGLVHP